VPEVVIAGAEELSDEGRPLVVEADGREIAVVRWKGKVYAVKNVCPHMSASFADGSAHDRIVCRADWEVDIDEGQPLLRCPWHGWDYDLRTGRCVGDTQLRVKTYAARVDGSRVLVDVR
jgi:nitrite reductase/ring-hydroxylating ferredoxin subunit